MTDPEKSRARDRLATVGYFASLISHRARNRLATIRAALELLEAGREADLSPELRSVLVQEMNRVLDDFNLGADMVRCHFGVAEPVGVRELADEALAAFRPRAERGRIAVATAYGLGAERALADRRLLRQVLLNLLANAAEALTGVGQPRIVLTTASEDGRFHLEIEDNGPGVPAAIHDRLLREPVAGGEGRSGLGLTLCRDALLLMDGRIRHLTPKGRSGARFRLSLPLAG